MTTAHEASEAPRTDMLTRMAWVELQYSKKRVRRAGELIGGGEGTPEEVAEARSIISNFRSSHSYPLLSVTAHVRGNALAVNPDAVVARRTKRLPTILDKLERHPRMAVDSMQDMGGCRIVLDSVAEVDTLVERLENVVRAKNTIHKPYDYIRGPQETGYRGRHLVYSYQASKVAYQGHKIEVQIRTRLMHSWATAIETMDLFSGSRLKYGEGPEQLKRFFAVTSGLMAIAEGTDPVPGVEGDIDDLRAELWRIDEQLHVVERLISYSSVASRFPSSGRRSTILLSLDRTSGQLSVQVFETHAEAEEALAHIESVNDEDTDAVLVVISKIGQLRSAYPNYFGDTEAFVEFVDLQLNELDAE